MDAVLVLNADLGRLHRVSFRHAIRMLVRQVAVVHEAELDRLIGTWPVPKVLRLVQCVVTRWRYTAGPAWSRPGVIARDGELCGYCAARATTIDHILPGTFPDRPIGRTPDSGSGNRQVRILVREPCPRSPAAEATV